MNSCTLYFALFWFCTKIFNYLFKLEHFLDYWYTDRMNLLLWERLSTYTPCLHFQLLARQQAQREEELAQSQRHILALQVSYQLSRIPSHSSQLCCQVDKILFSFLFSARNWGARAWKPSSWSTGGLFEILSYWHFLLVA